MKDEKDDKVITFEEHSKTCSCTRFVEISIKKGNLIVVTYKKCTKCGRLIKGPKYDLRNEYYFHNIQNRRKIFKFKKIRV